MNDPCELVCGWMVPTGDTHHARWIAERGEIGHDYKLLEWLWPYIKKGSTVVDIGAHIGTHAIPYLRAIGSDGTLVAIEPSPVNFCCLLYNLIKETVQWERPPAWHAEMVAAGEFGGLVKVIEQERNHGATYCVPENQASPTELRSISRSMSIRHLLGELGHDDKVSFIKVDAEGCEPGIINDLYLLPSKFSLFVEVNRGALSRAGGSVDELYSTIASNVDSKTHQVSIYQTGETLEEVPFREPPQLVELDMYDLLVSAKT